MPVQCTAADIIKSAMIRLHEALRQEFPDTNMILQVHDELVFDVPSGDLGRVSKLVQETMEHAAQLDVPLEVEMQVGRDWYDMSPIERVPQSVRAADGTP
jgi:DNA polymerase-1